MTTIVSNTPIRKMTTPDHSGWAAIASSTGWKISVIAVWRGNDALPVHRQARWAGSRGGRRPPTRPIFVGPPRARPPPVYANAAVKPRYSCVPLEWYAEEHAFGERNRLYVENALKLLEQAAGSALAQASLAPAAVDSLIVVSSTGGAAPRLGARLMGGLR